MQSKRNLVALVTLVLFAGCTKQSDNQGAPASEHLYSDRGGIGISSRAVAGAALSILPRRSLAVTDLAITSAFSLNDVLAQLVAQSGNPALTGELLFRQLWDTQNPAPGLGLGPHCTDNGNTLNTFPYACRPAEGSQASPDSPINPGSYVAIGLFNRFDLAPADGENCGEYRVVFAKNNAAQGRNLLTFEGVLPNPQPALKLEGCRPVANFWRDLTFDSDVASRASKLRDFYFVGLPGFGPVIHIDNLGVATQRTTGQIRTNQLMQVPWSLRELKLKRDCPSFGPCMLQATPVTVKANPFGGLFNPNGGHALTPDFQNNFFPSQVARLAVNDINTFNYGVPDKFNSGQSHAQDPVENHYVNQFGTAPSEFRANIQRELIAIGSLLRPDDIVERTMALSCAGCHQLSNGRSLGGGLVWPSSLNFVHVSEQNPEPGPEGPRFRISPALTEVFLPHREQVFEAFLASGTSDP